MLATTPNGQPVVALSDRSEEFRKVDYLLKLSLGKASLASDVQVWRFLNPQNASKFAQRNSSSQTIHAWLLESEACEGLLQTQGQVTNFPQTFVTGSIPSASHINKRGVRRIVLCQIALGKCFIQQDFHEEGENNNAKALPDGFDSILLHSSVPSEVYHQEYVLFDSYQVLPLYMVQYQTLPKKKSKSNEEAEANVYDSYDFFDPVDYVPVSIRDKMVGSHSQGEPSKHKLISLQDAYEIALSESEKPDLLLKQTTAELKTQLRQVDAKLRDVNANSAMVEEQLYKLLQDALLSLQVQTQERMQTLLSVELEVKRKLTHLEWAEQFLARQRLDSPPLEFLTIWKCHSQLRGELCDPASNSDSPPHFQINSVLNSVHADLECTGNVQVVSRRRQQSTLALMNSHALASPPRRGSGSMVLTGNSPVSSPSLPLKDSLSAPGATHGDEAPPMLLNDVSSSSVVEEFKVEPDLDVTKAFVRALRMESNSNKRLYDEEPPSSLIQVAPVRRPAPSQQLAPTTNTTTQPTPAVNPFSLREEAVRRLRQLSRGLRNQDQYVEGLHRKQVFAASKLLQHEPIAENGGLSQALTLFLSLPVNVDVQIPVLLYSTLQVPTSPKLSDLVNTLPRQRIVIRNAEGKDVEDEKLAHVPSVLIIKANGNRVFGGYISEPFHVEEGNFGTSRCFLFSVDADTKYSFLAREVLPPNPRIVEFCAREMLPVPKFASMSCTEDQLQFGVGDLVIKSNLKEGSCDLERSYGVGNSPLETSMNRAVLCGSEHFQIEALEFWGIFSQH